MTVDFIYIMTDLTHTPAHSLASGGMSNNTKVTLLANITNLVQP